MEPDEYDRIAAVEDEHWWYLNTRSLLLEMLEPWIGASGSRRPGLILDIGCGPGGNARVLSQLAPVLGVDRSAAALRHGQLRTSGSSVQFVQADAAAVPLGSACVDVATCVHVLYTLRDHTEALAEVARVLKPGGVVFLMEPAFPALRRGHDRKVHGERRFRRGELAESARAVGLRTRRSTFAYSFLVPPAAALAAADRIRPVPSSELRSDLERRSMDRLFGRMAKRERRMIKRGFVPFGTSTVVLAERA